LKVKSPKKVLNDSLPRYTLEDMVHDLVPYEERLKDLIVDLAKHVLMLRKLITKESFKR
jgi:hypothetical protein